MKTLLTLALLITGTNAMAYGEQDVSSRITMLENAMRHEKIARDYEFIRTHPLSADNLSLHNTPAYIRSHGY